MRNCAYCVDKLANILFVSIRAFDVGKAPESEWIMWAAHKIMPVYGA